MKLSNPLTLEEKFQLPRLVGHDFLEAYSNLIALCERTAYQGAPLDMDGINSCGRIMRDVAIVQSDLAHDTIHLRNYKRERLLETFNDLKLNHRPAIHTVPESTGEFYSNPFLLNVLLHNLVKNAKNASATDKSPVFVYATSVDDVPKTCTYLPPEHAPGPYVRFSVHNNGRPFPETMDPVERMTKTSKGFGLYFLGMTSRALRAPVHVVRDTDKTIVALYHPLYTE